MWDRVCAAVTAIAIAVTLYQAWMIVSIFWAIGATFFASIVAFWALAFVIDLLVSLSKQARRIWKADE